MGRKLFWAAGGLLAFVLLLWLDDEGLYVGPEIHTGQGTLRGRPVRLAGQFCRYLTLRGIEVRFEGLVPGTNPETLMADGSYLPVAPGNCRRSYPWQVVTGVLPSFAQAGPRFTALFVDQLGEITIAALTPTVFRQGAIEMYVLLHPEKAGCAYRWFDSGDGILVLNGAFRQNPNRIAVEIMKEVLDEACP